MNAPQNREVSGHEGEMLVIGGYLVAGTMVVRLRELVLQLAVRHRDLERRGDFERRLREISRERG